MQMKIQQAVEGFSVIAISCYGLLELGGMPRQTSDWQV